MNYSLNVSAAFELIVEELTNVIGETDLTGIQAWQSGNYDRAQDIIALVKKLTEFQAKVRGLSADWQKFAADTPIKPADGANMNTPPKVDRNLANGVEVIMRTKGIEARGVYRKGNFRLLKGSHVSQAIGDSLQTDLRELRNELEQKGILKYRDKTKFVLEQDQVFGSPSAAAKFVAGISVSGPRDWKLLSDDRSLGEYIKNVEKK